MAETPFIDPNRDPSSPCLEAEMALRGLPKDATRAERIAVATRALRQYRPLSQADQNQLELDKKLGFGAVADGTQYAR